jgi:hypothetical protein
VGSWSPRPGFTEEDLEITRGFMVRNNAGAFETPGAKVGLLSAMSAYGFPATSSSAGPRPWAR